jgi:O-antigen/teichoic acid export membrane protein
MHKRKRNNPESENKVVGRESVGNDPSRTEVFGTALHFSNEKAVRPLSLRMNFSWNFIGNIIYAGCQWGILVVMARLTSPEMVGRFALGLAITAPIFLFCELQLRGVQATDARDDFTLGQYLALRLFMVLLALIVIAGYVAAGDYGKETALIILSVGFSKGFESIADILYGFMQRHEQMDRIARSRILKGVLALAAMAVFIPLTGDVFWGVVGMGGAWAIVLVFYDLKNAVVILSYSDLNNTKTGWTQIKPQFDHKKMMQLAWLALPLGLVMTMISLNTNIPRYFIDMHYGEANLGIFAAIAYLMHVGSQVMSALSQSAAPRLAIYNANRVKKPFLRVFYFLGITAFCLGAGGIIVALIFGGQILQIVYGPDYAERSDLFVWLMTAAAFSYFSWVIGVPLTAMRIFRFQMFIAFVSVSVLFLSCRFLVVPYGLSGAAMALVFSHMTSFLIGSIMLFMYIRRSTWK